MRLPIAQTLALFALFTGCARKNPEERAMTARDSLKSIHLSDDFHVELVASEPEVMSPVEMAFDENGKIYVAEMMDYPEDPPPASGCSRTQTGMARSTAPPSLPITCWP